VLVPSGQAGPVLAAARQIGEVERDQARRIREGQTLRQQTAFDDYLARDPRVDWRGLPGTRLARLRASGNGDSWLANRDALQTGRSARFLAHAARPCTQGRRQSRLMLRRRRAG